MLFSLLCSVSAHSADSAIPAEQRTILSCDGEWTNFGSNPDKSDRVPLRSVFVEVTLSQVRVVESIGLDGAYRVTRRDEAGFAFTQEVAPRFEGSLNRLSGDVNLHFWNEDHTRLARDFNGQCRKASPLF
jgi:hypothetical protein